MEESPLLTETESPSLVVEGSGLTYRFGRFVAVDGLDLAVRAGEIYGFLGRNGAGKTTTIRMLMGVLRPHGGTLRFFEGAARKRTGLSEKRRIGYVGQTQHFYPWMHAEQLGRFVGGLYPKWDDAEFRRLLGVFELPPRRRVSALSGGMRVKLGLALALGANPDLLILDEPMAGLDAVARREFLDIVREQARRHGRTTFFSSHRIHEVERICDRVGIVNRGQLLYEGTIGGLMSRIRQLGSSAEEDPAPLPDGVRLLHEEILEGRRQRVVMAEEGPWSESFRGEDVQELSLEEAFVALVRDETPQL